MFRGKLTKRFPKEPNGPGRRHPFDHVLMFKVLVLQRLYNLSDAQMQYQLLDRPSLLLFAGAGFHRTVPDEKMIWASRENLAAQGTSTGFSIPTRRIVKSRVYMCEHGEHHRCLLCRGASPAKQP